MWVPTSPTLTALFICPVGGIDMANTTELDWLALVLQADPDHYKRDVCYEWSNGREMHDTDDTDSGVYDGT